MKVFISHSSTDKKFVRTLKEDLKENGFNTWVDEDELDFGDSLIEKLSSALEESSHFLIILSPTSVNSDWVKFELGEALKKKETHLHQKIVPVKYSNCVVPEELEKMLYADLSKEVRRIQGEKVYFVSSAYDNFLDKLCKTLRNTEQSLTNQERVAIKRELSKEHTQGKPFGTSKIIKATYNVKGYTDSTSRLKYIKIVQENITTKQLQDENTVRPVLLPPLLKMAFVDLKIGDVIFFSNNYLFNEMGYFAGFRKDDLSITIEAKIRRAIGIQKGCKYNVEIDVSQRRITFLTGQ